MKPFTKNRFHYNWHWIWDTGNGDLGNQGIHEVDLARWGLGVTLPTKVTALGGHFLFDDDQQTPNVITVAYEFKSPGERAKLMTFEVRGWMTNHEAGIGTPEFGGGGVPDAGLKPVAASRRIRRRKIAGAGKRQAFDDRELVLRIERVSGDLRLQLVQIVSRSEAMNRGRRSANRSRMNIS